MELEQSWKELSEAGDSSLPDPAVIYEKLKQKTMSPLYKIKRNLEISFIWMAFFTLLYIAAIIFLGTVYIKTGIAILIGYNLLSSLQAWSLYKKITPDVQGNNSLKSELERNYINITQWWRLQLKNAFFVYPISIVTGFFAGVTLTDASRLSVIMQKPLFWIVLGGCFVVILPLSFLLVRWMMKLTYGKQLDYLKEMICLLDTPPLP